MLLTIPIVHGRQHRLALMDRKDRSFGQHFEVFVGYDRRDFNNHVGFGLEPGHLEIYPYEIFWRLHCG